MTLRFSYLRAPSSRPLVTLGGRMHRPRPVIGVTVVGPAGSWLFDALIDCGADDTVFPDRVAALSGIDLTNAPAGTGSGMGRGTVAHHFAEVMMRIADNYEQREWTAWVGFTAAPMRYPMLGFAGFLEYFTATLIGDREEVELTVNSLYPGT
jgi:hypothetical protein